MAYEKLPLIIYGINNENNKQPLGHNFVAYKNCVTIWSYVKFDISVVSGECNIAKIKSVIDGNAIKKFPQKNNYELSIEWILQDDKYKAEIGKMFSGDLSSNTYVLIIESDCQINIGGTIYSIRLELDNKFSYEIDDKEDNNWPKQHYNDLLVNYYLPTWEELEPAVFDIGLPNAKRELIKRMLLDFRKIISVKGTIESIRLFFKFVNLQNVLIFEEYAHENNNGTISKTISPNKLTDWKTGDYHVLMKNYNQEDGYAGFDRKNMPIRKLYIDDWEEFFEKLIVAISLADKYFTLPEQQISFFGIEFSSNAHLYLPIQMWGQKIYQWSPYHFQRNININIFRHYTENKISYLVKNKQQISNLTFMSEVKALIENMEESNLLFFVDKEIYDDSPLNNENLNNYYSYFGNILHLEITVPNQKYVRVYIENASKPDTNLLFEKQLIGNSENEETLLELLISTIEIGKYNIRIDVWDVWNNRETYNYEYEISAQKHEIDFETFSSIVVKEEQNVLTLEPSSPSIKSLFSSNIFNFVLDQNSVPDDLSDYYNVDLSKAVISKDITNNKRYILPDFKTNWVLDEVTDTLPLEYIDSWIDVITFPYDATKELKLRIYNGDTCVHEIIDYDKISEYLSETTDCIFVTLLDITVERETGETYTEPYYMLTTTSVGIDFRTSYDFVLVDKNTNEIISIYENKNLKTRRLPLNYDIELFCRKSEVVPDFKHYISCVDANAGEIKILKSIFPRLINIKEDEADGNFVEFGDVILCRLDEKYVADYADVEWNLRNAFTKEIIFSSTDESLKYRVDEINVFDVEVNFTIRGQQFTIYKESLFTSFISKI